MFEDTAHKDDEKDPIPLFMDEDNLSDTEDEVEWQEGEWSETDFAEYADFAEEFEGNLLQNDAGKSLGILTICGRPNVGKSSLVNRIIGRREAVVEDVPGVTRDKVNYRSEWNGHHFTLQDTGGWEPKPSGVYFSVAKQSEIAIRNSDVVIMVADATVGITAEDEQLAKSIRRAHKTVILAVNKVDNEQIALQIGEFWALGLGEPYPISATHGSGVADILDLAVEMLIQRAEEQAVEGREPDYSYHRVALVGKPNVGKSSLLNKLSQEERAIVSPMAGTTIDPVDSLVDLGNETWRIIDTAGLKRRYHMSRGHEYYATLRTEAAIEAAEVVLVLIDSSEPLSEQDLRIISLVMEMGRAMIILFNKWDVMDEDRRYDLDREIDLQLERVAWAKRLNISATTGRGIHRIESAMNEALASWNKRISTGQLNQWLRTIISATPPPMRGGKLPRVLFITQAAISPPTFVLFTTGFLEAGYRRFLERKLRESFGFEGSPIKITMKIREKRNSRT